MTRIHSIFQCLIVLLLGIKTIFAQEINFPLKNISEFKASGTNWQIVQNASSNFQKSKDLTITPGTGVLANVPSSGANGADLYSNFDHGDIQLEFEFLMPKESNSGIYLMGRYEVQLYDSWGKTNLNSGDCGGIYERWDEKKPLGQQGYLGVPPTSNPLKVPGAWNKMKINFEAPRFKNGVKISNAKIIQVVINGIIVQENVSLSGPTRGAMSDTETEKGPLRIQGDHGPVAFRNFKYALFESGDEIKISDFEVTYYQQAFGDKLNYWDIKPKSITKSKYLDISISDIQNNYAFVNRSTITIPKDGDYTFDVVMNGKSFIVIANDTVGKFIKGYYTREYSDFPTTSTVYLKAGNYPLTIAYWKVHSWLDPAFGLFITGGGVKRQALHNMESLPPQAKPMHVRVNNETPKVMRHFLSFNGKFITHPAWVADPSKMNYAINPENMAFLQFWRGDFLDMNESWFERGGKPVLPLGNVYTISNMPTLARLSTPQTNWPDSISNQDFSFKGYFLDEVGKPTFKYKWNKMDISEKIVSDAKTKEMTRTITINGNSEINDIYAYLTEGASINMITETLYMINNDYYIKINDVGGVKPIIRNSSKGKQLIVPVKVKANNPVSVSYAIIW
ncbi:MAG: family 16 glycoside hydrolase [Bacteroidota bacterium]|nr:family 16 glycoside hydrolase [Bacteroidota bacterium]